MNNIWDYFKQLFQESEESSPSKPFIREEISRSEDEKEAFELWKRTQAAQKMLDFINKEYAHHLIEPEKMDDSFGVLNTASTNGFIIHFSELRHNQKDIEHLFDYLKEIVLKVGYKHYMSDTRTYNRKLWVEKVERHYLKPPIKFDENETSKKLLIQRYGNILIELLFRNDHLVNLKLRATNYHDHNFTEASNFSDLIKEIVQNG
jgi:hypothetical protein